MKKKLLILTLTMILAFSCSMTALASPQTMPDGATFDPSFYGRSYPDVLEAVGISTEALYQHYVNYGKAEGRLPYDPNPQTFMPQVQPVVGADGQVTLMITWVNTSGEIVNPNPTYGSFQDAFAEYMAARQQQSALAQAQAEQAQ